jgi:tight adherence protein B
MFNFELDPLIVFYVMIAASLALAVEAVYLLLYSKKNYANNVNRRLRVMNDEADRTVVLSELRRERGISSDGQYMLGLKALNRLIVQSGTTLGIQKIGFMAVLSAIGFGIFVFIWRNHPWQALGAAVFGGTLFPLMVLKYLRKKRHNKFGEQFPEAIDIIIRSLRAGHPVPVAIAMVARELPDPVGTEFGMVSDEIAYGSDLETAMRNMMERVGQEDLPLFVTSISIQATTGGNLAEILNNLTSVIRERFKIRRKIKGLSAEGKASSMILTSVPFIIFMVLNVLSPNFYGEVWNEPVTRYFIGGALFWMALGNLVMRKMINFKI